MNEKLRCLQWCLRALDYYRGPEDGIMNEGLQQALEDFQIDYGLPLSREPDDSTVKLLRTQLALKQKHL